MPNAKTEDVGVTLQERIKAKFGQEKIHAARMRLCHGCVKETIHCSLLPITSGGGDCPYFRRSGIV